MIEIKLCGKQLVGGSRVSIRGANSRAGAAVVAALVERGWRQVTAATTGMEDNAVLERPPRTGATQIEADVLDPDCPCVQGDERD